MPKTTTYHSDEERRLLEYLRKRKIRMRHIAALFDIKDARHVRNSTAWKKSGRPGKIIEFLKLFGHDI